MMITLDHGDNVTFSCSSMGGPDNMYIWVRNASEEVCLDCEGETDLKSFLEGIIEKSHYLFIVPIII